jgi:hypothetical protein
MSELFNKLKNIRIEYILIYSIIWYSRVLNNVKDCVHSIYKNNKYVRYSYDFMKQQYTHYIQQKMEPLDSSWFCVYDIYENQIYDSDKKYSSILQYSHLNELNVENHDTTDSLLKLAYDSFEKNTFETLKKYLIHENQHIFCTMKLTTLENNVMYICRKINLFMSELSEGEGQVVKGEIEILEVESEASEESKVSEESCEQKLIEQKEIIYQPSNVRFMVVEYENPAMKKRIELEISREWLIDGNDLFVPVHVMHLLERQSEPYVFDLNYKIHIMDTNFKTKEIDADHYLHLKKHDYTIVSSLL